jgi:DNA-binding response OmpR family regulator
MVPTLTRLGLLAGVRGLVCTVAVVTAPLLRHPVGDRYATPRLGVGIGSMPVMKVVVYSHDADVRAQIKLAIGRRPAMDVPEAEIVEVATVPALFRLLDAGGADVMVLDGEAQPYGGMGVCRQAKDEIYNCPPALLIVGRVDDGWLATWSRADAVISHPIDPLALARELAGLMRERAVPSPL